MHNNYSAQNVSKTFRCSFSIPLTEADAAYQSLSGLQAKFKVSRMRMQITQSWDCAHVVITCAISRLEHNLGIPRVGNAVSRLRKFPDCVAHNHNHRDNKSWYLSLKNSSHYKTRGWEKYRRQCIEMIHSLKGFLEKLCNGNFTAELSSEKLSFRQYAIN